MTTTSRDAWTRFWPVFGLRLATPRLVLRPVCDDDLAEIVDLVLTGIHPPEQMPFLVPWTDAPPGQLADQTLRHFWRSRALSTPDEWSVLFGVRAGGRLLGIQELTGQDFPITRTVATGSWLGHSYQGHGYGTEMRAAVVDFAFDHLKATRAESAAFTDNPASGAVSRKLGYVANGDQAVQRRLGEAATNQRLLLTPTTFRRPGWAVQVAGFELCRAAFGV